MDAEQQGRLSQPPHLVLFDLLYRPAFARGYELHLPYLLRIDAAHVSACARAHATSLTTAFTHLQPAQPSTPGHYLCAALGGMSA